MNTKFFFSAIALFAITSVANARPIGRDGKPLINEEVATSAVIKGARVSGVNEEVALRQDFKRVEVMSGMEVAARKGPHFPPYIVDTETPMEVAYFNPWTNRC